jgi:hypothetical protein
VTTTAYTTLATTDCIACGVVFGMPEDMLQARREGGGSFWCPNGHSLSYAKPEVQRLREQLDASRRNADFWRDQEKRERQSHAATKGILTKTKKRVGNGVCPCCKRHFVNLERHMQGQHPGYATEEA